MIQEHVYGSLIDIDESGMAVIKAAIPSIDRLLKRKSEVVEIIIPDGRRISSIQRRKCFSLLGEIAEFVHGYRNAETTTDVKEMTKWDFVLKRMESQERRLFSLSNCDMTTARNYIDYLIEFIIRNDIPTRVSLIDNCEDVQRYVYACLMNKKCCICGKACDLHHIDAIGMGNDRNKVQHIGRECLPLCREHHTEIHKIGRIDFFSKYHVEPITIDAQIAKKYKLNK